MYLEIIIFLMWPLFQLLSYCTISTVTGVTGHGDPDFDIIMVAVTGHGGVWSFDFWVSGRHKFPAFGATKP